MNDQLHHYRLPDGNVQIAFSGGRTSAYMLHQILEANGALPERCRVVFSNTGREFDATLDFVQEVGSRWGVAIDWVEYRPGKPWFETVSHNSASRDGQPFDALIRKRRYLPNVDQRFCTVELKILTARRYCRSLKWDHWITARGLRADESHRVKPSADKRITHWHPLHVAGATKETVTDFWKSQPFDLRLIRANGQTPDGNCDGCFLKSEAYLARLAIRHPERAQWWEDMESIASDLTSNPNGARFNKRYSRKEHHAFVRRNIDMLDLLEQTGGLCQADDGECT